MKHNQQQKIKIETSSEGNKGNAKFIKISEQMKKFEEAMEIE